MKDVFIKLFFGSLERPSHTRVWSNIAYLVFSGIVIYKTMHGGVSDDLLLYYVGVLACHTSFSKWIATRTKAD